MGAFLIGHITVKDSAKWLEYRSKVPATLVPWQGQVIFRGQRLAVLSGEHAFTDTVVIQFPEADSIERWYGSPAYQALIPLRQQAAEMVMISYEITG